MHISIVEQTCLITATLTMWQWNTLEKIFTLINYHLTASKIQIIHIYKNTLMPHAEIWEKLPPIGADVHFISTIFPPHRLQWQIIVIGPGGDVPMSNHDQNVFMITWCVYSHSVCMHTILDLDWIVLITVLSGGFTNNWMKYKIIMHCSVQIWFDAKCVVMNSN